MKIKDSQVFFVGKWQIEPRLNRISHGEEAVTLPPKAMLALQILAQDPLQPKSHDELMTAIWEEQVVSEASLYQLIAQLRKSLGDTESPRQYIEKVSGKGYRLIADVSEGGTSQASPGRARSSRNFLVVLLISAIVIVFVPPWLRDQKQDNQIEPVVDSSAALTDIESLLFTTFRPYQKAADSDYVSLGLSDSVLARLSELDDLKVITYRKSMTREDVLGSEIAETVDSVLSGFVQKEGEQLRVVIQLYDSKNASLLWTKVFDGDTASVFALQDRIATELISQLSTREPSRKPSFKVTDKVYQDYLLGRFYWSKRTLESLQQAELVFERLMVESPEFPLTYVGMCDTYMFYAIYSNWQADKANSLCEPLLEKALVLDPELGQAHASLGQLLAAQGRYNEARVAYENAIKFAPNYALTYLWYGNLLRNFGEVDKAYTMIQKSLELDPLSPIVNRQLAFTYLNLGRFSDAAQAYERALALESNYTDRPVDELNFFPLNVKRASEFLQWAEDNPKRITQIDIHKLPYTAVLMSVGKQQEAEAALTAYGRKFTGHQFYLFLKASLAMEKGEREEALEYLKMRSENFNDNPNLSNSYIGALAYLGQEENALELFNDTHGATVNGGIQLEALSENNYRLWLFYDELLELNNIKGDFGFRKSLDAYLKQNFDKENVFHLFWLQRNGQEARAIQLGTELLTSGWLPDYNNEFLSKERFRSLFEGDANRLQWFDVTLKGNQKKALGAVE